MMKISIGSDHRGFALKKYLIDNLDDYDWRDVGTFDEQRTDYPMYARKVCDDIEAGTSAFGVLICGSGIGMAIAANRIKGVYAALCWNEDSARVARQDDGSNILVFPSDFVTSVQAVEMFKAWISASFKGGRYQQRLEMIDGLSH